MTMGEMRSPMILTEGLVKRFGQRVVVDDLSFSLREGEITGLLGPNGSGKTTVVRLLNGLLRPDRGKISIGGLDPATSGDVIRKISGVLTESADFYRHMTGLQNLNFFGKLYGVHDEARRIRLLDMFGLGPHRHKKVGTYSTGMRKRLGLAKALLHEPRLLFLDEPTNGLDPEGVRLVLDHIKKLNKQFGTTILICSHLLNQMEEICDHYLFIDKGRLIEQGTLPDLRKRHEHHIVVKIEMDDVPGKEHIGPAVIEAIEPGSIGKCAIHLALKRKEEIPYLLERLVKQTSVYSSIVYEMGLESLYFKVRMGRADR